MDSAPERLAETLLFFKQCYAIRLLSSPALGMVVQFLAEFFNQRKRCRPTCDPSCGLASMAQHMDGDRLFWTFCSLARESAAPVL